MSMKNQCLDIVMTGYAGLAASKKMAIEHREVLNRTLTRAFLDSLQRIPEEHADEEGHTVPDVFMACPYKDSSLLEEPMMVEVARGGILEALWNLADLAGVGLNVNMEKIPIRQETIEVCEILDENPYQMPSGCRIYLTVNGNTHPGSVIGQTNASKARTITTREGVRYLDKPRHKGE